MIRLQIIDNIFGPAKYVDTVPYHDKIQWTKNRFNNDIMFYTDMNLTNVSKTVKTNIAWIVESPEITKGAYTWIRNNYDKFDYVLTFDKQLLEISDKFILNNIGECWIKPEDQKVYKKTKNISIIASGKNQTHGHQLRHEIIRNIKNIDVYGRGYKPVENKVIALKDYRYSIVIENVKKDYYFSEKLIDSFRTGTVPIFYGCPSIGDFFDIRGMIIFDNVYELNKEISELTDEKYNSMKKYIDINFEKAKNYCFAEDNIYDILKMKKII